jgi:hypothetical protein
MRKFLNVFRVECRRYSEFDVIHALEVGGLPKKSIEGVYEKIWRRRAGAASRIVMGVFMLYLSRAE